MKPRCNATAAMTGFVLGILLAAFMGAVYMGARLALLAYP